MSLIWVDIHVHMYLNCKQNFMTSFQIFLLSKSPYHCHFKTLVVYNQNMYEMGILAS